MPTPLSVRYAPAALAEIDGIYDYIARDNPSAAAKVLTEVRDAVLLLSTFPEKARKMRRRGMFALPLSRYPYIIFFRILRDELEILHIRHGARRHPGFQEDAAEFVHV